MMIKAQVRQPHRDCPVYTWYRESRVRFTFCAVCLLEHARRNGLPSPTILGLSPASLLWCRLRCRRDGQRRWVRLLAFGLLLTKPLLLTGLTLQVVLALTQAVLLLPSLFPALIEQREPQRQHGIDVLGFPMHAWSFEPRLHNKLVTTLHTARANWPASGTVGWIVHQLVPLLQVGQLFLDLWVAPD